MSSTHAEELTPTPLQLLEQPLRHSTPGWL